MKTANWHIRYKDIYKLHTAHWRCKHHHLKWEIQFCKRTNLCSCSIWSYFKYFSGQSSWRSTLNITKNNQNRKTLLKNALRNIRNRIKTQSEIKKLEEGQIEPKLEVNLLKSIENFFIRRSKKNVKHFLSPIITKSTSIVNFFTPATFCEYNMENRRQISKNSD